MGFLDDMAATLNKGASITAKTANVLKLKAQVADLNSQRRNLCAGLGAAVYDRTRGDAAFIAGLEDFYSGIEGCDERIADLQRQIEQVEASESVIPGKDSRWMKTCPTCGCSLNAADMFCSRCGAPVPQGAEPAQQAAPGPQQPGATANATHAASQTPHAHKPIDVDPC